MKKRIISHGGLGLDIETVKCFKISDDEPKVLIVEHKKRVEYIKNPNTGKYEKIELNDISKYEFANYDMASTYKAEWEEIWEKYLKNKKS